MDLSNQLPYICNFCSATDTPVRPLQRCGGCHLVAYCSKECQKDERRGHRPICKEFPVVNGINVFHTTGPWEEHLANLRERAARFPEDNHAASRLFRDPKVCHTCRESRPSRLSICKCNFVCYCSKKCAGADKKHKDACSGLCFISRDSDLERMRASYPMTLYCVVEEMYMEYQKKGIKCSIIDLAKLKVHVVTNSAYFDAKTWEILFHQPTVPNLKHLELVFISHGMPFNESFNHKGKLNELDCTFCKNHKQKLLPKSNIYESKDHSITYSVYQKPYHMFYSSPEYSEPDMVIVYGISDISSDIHSEISYRNMLYSQESMLVLTDSTEDLVIQGSEAVNAARPVEKLIPPMRNPLRFFGSNQSEMVFDGAATNEKNYLTCLGRK